MRIAVALHLLNYTLAPEFKAWLTNIPHPFDLFLTVPDDGAKARRFFPMAAAIFAHHPNQGMDIGGFFAVLPLILRGKYEVVLKLHSKTSDGWRRGMVNALCGSPARTNYCLSLFQDPRVGSVTQGARIYSTQRRRATNERHLNDLCRTWKVPYLTCNFAGGTMFWMRVSVLATAFKGFKATRVIATLNTPTSLDGYWYLRHYKDLGLAGLTTKEQAVAHYLRSGKKERRLPNGLAGRMTGALRAVDGMIEHAYERFFGMIVAQQRLRLVGV